MVSKGISYDDLVERIGQDKLENNAFVAGRMPPLHSTGLHPESFYGVYEKGGLMDILKEELGPAASSPSAKLDFKQSAMNPNESLASLVISPKMGQFS
jgi:hypothetical protein